MSGVTYSMTVPCKVISGSPLPHQYHTITSQLPHQHHKTTEWWPSYSAGMCRTTTPSVYRISALLARYRYLHSGFQSCPSDFTATISTIALSTRHYRGTTVVRHNYFTITALLPHRYRTTTAVTASTPRNYRTTTSQLPHQYRTVTFRTPTPRDATSSSPIRQHSRTNHALTTHNYPTITAPQPHSYL